MKSIFIHIFIMCLFTGTLTFSQAPANDNPSGAIALTVGTACNASTKTAGDLTDTTNSNVGGTPSCGFPIESDIWYTAEVPATGNLLVEVFVTRPGYYQLRPQLSFYYKDELNNYIEFGCYWRGSSHYSEYLTVLTGLTVGTTIYIRLWEAHGNSEPFEICARSVDTPPNNNPDSATALPVSADSCGGNTAGDLTYATNSGVGGTPPSCGDSISSDVWYTTVAPASGNLTIETFNVSDDYYFDTVLTAYTKDDSGFFSEVGCDDNSGGDSSLSKLILTGQTEGTTLYIRVWGRQGERYSFELCAWEPSPLSTLETAENTLIVYPNPTHNILHIDTQILLKSATIYSLTGQQVLSSSLVNESMLNVSALPSGVYLLKITHKKGNQYVKFIKE